jgi:hypothetical protein
LYSFDPLLGHQGAVMSKRMVATLVVALLMTLCLSVTLAAKDNPMGIAEKQTLVLSDPTVIAGTLVPAGNYTVTHEMQGQTHIMVFKQQGGGKVEVKATCTLVPLTAKATQTEEHFKENAKNQKVLIEMIFKGDTAKHVLEQ